MDRRMFLSAAGMAALSASANGRDLSPSGAGDATALALAIRAKRMSATEAVEAAISRAEKAQPLLNFLVSDTFAAAREAAKSPGDRPFAGAPFLVKDLNDRAGAVTRSGSRSTAGAKPAPADDAFVAAMTRAGFITIGKSASPEFGYLPTTEPLAFGPTHNPWDLTRSSGGSSGGSAAAVAAGVVPIAHANDGGGSIRIPAANCGLFGLKPSRGRMTSAAPGARPLEIAVQGCVSRTVRDSALFLSLVEETRSGAPLSAVGYVAGPTKRRLKVGLVIKSFQGAAPHPDVEASVMKAGKLLESLGHSVAPTTWPVDGSFSDDFLAFWALGAAADAAAVAKALGRPPTDKDLEPFSLALAANAARLSPADIQAVEGRLIKAAAAYDGWIKGFDVVVSPVMATPPRPLGYFRGDTPFEVLEPRLKADVGYTLIHNVAGAPSMSVPLGQSTDGLPIGVQVCAGWGAERTLLELAYELEAAQPWASRRPKVWVG